MPDQRVDAAGVGDVLREAGVRDRALERAAGVSSVMFSAKVPDSTRGTCGT